ncbi:PAS domain-containing protein [Hoeflea sp. G2-23]|uniref:PAS domain-containing protein n=1 Tax=Hoeflea algicola TaxID=2983763 RepID=A0ABT3Z5G9_9HYPH|nr:PAS domain-containing protein [Hoeflea algicola]MCY0147007.1 PAS domain-containing protein [Hoeflea algicola]
MRHKKSLELFDYWISKCAGRAAPSRTDIEPADIRGLLPHVFICDLAGKDSLSFRLAGTAVCALYAKELKATPFAALWLTDGVRNAGRTGAAVATGATPSVLSLDGLSQGGHVVHAEMLLLPITGPTGEHDRLIGLVSVFEPPYWIGHDPLAGFSTTGIRFLDQTREPLFLGNRPEIKLPPAQGSGFRAAHAENRRRVAHLIVLEGGRRD